MDLGLKVSFMYWIHMDSVIITWLRNKMIHTLESSTIRDLMFKSLGEDKEQGVTTNSVTQRTLRGSKHDIDSRNKYV